MPHSSKKLKRWVIKAGSNMICSGGPLLLKAWMQQLAILKKKYGIEVIWVTSGAIASAIERMGYQKRKRTLPEKQALSAVGQPLVMDLYNLALQSVGLLGAQILLSYDDLKNKSRLMNFNHTVEQLLEWGVTPILNENDAVATEEIKFGDNDSLSAWVAHCTRADRLVILTDVEGLYDADPRVNSKARLVKRVEKVTQTLLSRSASQAGTDRGTGGMLSKLRAAQFASQNSIETWLVKGDVPQILLKIAENDAVGTVIEAQKSKRKSKSPDKSQDKSQDKRKTKS